MKVLGKTLVNGNPRNEDEISVELVEKLLKEWRVYHEAFRFKEAKQ